MTEQLPHLGVGVGGTGLAAILSPIAPDAAALAGLLTAAWMARQLWLSFKPKK
jgi:hypothetical protein